MLLIVGSPWDEDKAMMGRWGLEGMASFEQPNVARKEGARLHLGAQDTSLPEGPSQEAQTSV